MIAEKGKYIVSENTVPYRHNEAGYIFENLEVQRLKLGMTINCPADRLKSINDMWVQIKATCQICGGRRLIHLRDRLMPTHTTAGAHQLSGHCSGSFKPPLERDASLAEPYLDDLKQRHSRSAGTEKGSLTRMIKNLEKRIEQYKDLKYPVGKWNIGVFLYSKC